MRLTHIPYHCWEKSGLAHFIQVCRLQLLSWYLHFLAIQAGSSIVFSLMKNFHEGCWWNTWDIATRLAVFAPHLLPLSPSCSSSSFPPHVGSLRVSLLLSRQLHCHSPAAHRTPWTSVWFGNETMYVLPTKLFVINRLLYSPPLKINSHRDARHERDERWEWTTLRSLLVLHISISSPLSACDSARLTLIFLKETASSQEWLVLQATNAHQTMSHCMAVLFESCVRFLCRPRVIIGSS